MRILLDECVNRRLKSSFSVPGVVHVSDVGLDTLKNGALLRAADPLFDVMITIDKNMPFQSNLRGLSLSVIVMDARNNSLPELQTFVADVEKQIPTVAPGTFVVVRRPR